MGSARPYCCKILSLRYFTSNSTKKKKKKTHGIVQISSC